ncbi:SDR family oxidoreductase [Anaerolineales bacterium]
MKVFVITGSTRGIGLGLAEECLKRDCAVVISSRSQAAVDQVVTELTKKYGSSRIWGHACDMSDYAQVQSLWDAAIKAFNKVDYWINNAGIDLPNQMFWELDVADFQSIVNINLIGVMNGSHIALKGMLAQNSGQIFNMEGFGSGNQMRPGYTAYGSTKRALTYFTQSLAKEVQDKPVKVCTLSPGIVITELLLGSYTSEEAKNKAKKIFNILGDKVETVTPYLIDEILKNTKNGASIAWLSTPKVALRFMTSPFKKRDLFSES